MYSNNPADLFFKKNECFNTNCAWHPFKSKLDSNLNFPASNCPPIWCLRSFVKHYFDVWTISHQIQFIHPANEWIVQPHDALYIRNVNRKISYCSLSTVVSALCYDAFEYWCLQNEWNFKFSVLADKFKTVVLIGWKQWIFISLLKLIQPNSE